MSFGDWLIGGMLVASVFLLFLSISAEAQGGGGLAVFLVIPIGWAVAIVVKALE